MNAPDDQASSKNAPASHAGSTPARSPAAGLWGLGLLGLVLFIVALVTAAWLGSSLRPPQPAAPPAQGLAFDADKASLETKDLQTRAMQQLSTRSSTATLLPEAQQLAQRWPRYAPALTLLAQLQMNNGQMDKAYESLTQSLTLDSQQPQVHELAGTVALGLGKYEQAASHFAQLSGMQPDNARYRVNLAQAYTNMREHDKARMTLLQALQIDATLHEAYFAMSSLDAREGKLQQAIIQAIRAIDLLPEDRTQGPRVAYVRWLGNLLRRDNRPDDALAVFDNLDDKQRRLPAVLEDMAIAWQMLGKPQHAAKLYEDALALSPEQAPLAIGAARWYIKANDKPAASRMAAALRRINPTAPELLELEPQLR